MGKLVLQICKYLIYSRDYGQLSYKPKSDTYLVDIRSSKHAISTFYSSIIKLKPLRREMYQNYKRYFILLKRKKFRSFIFVECDALAVLI